MANRARAALVALVVATFGCSSSDSTDSGTASSSSGSSTTTSPTTATIASPPAPGTDPLAATTTASTATTAAPATAPATATPVDGAALLQQAVIALGSTYHYNSVVTVDGEVALTADGDRVGDGTRLGVVRGDAVVQYIITADGTWVQPEGGDWDQLDVPAATADPISALATPLAVTVDGATPDAATLSVTVSPESLGLAGTDPVVLTVVIEAGALRTIAYTTTIDGRPAVIQTTLSPVVDGSPVVAPA